MKRGRAELLDLVTSHFPLLSKFNCNSLSKISSSLSVDSHP
jgi:hypothetical protein